MRGPVVGITVTPSVVFGMPSLVLTGVDILGAVTPLGLGVGVGRY